MSAQEKILLYTLETSQLETEELRIDFMAYTIRLGYELKQVLQSHT